MDAKTLDDTDAYVMAGISLVNVPMLTRYDRSGASSRLRMLQYAEALSAEGVTATVCPFFDASYLERLYSGQSVLTPTARAYLRRLRQLRAASQADAAWLEKEALPWLPWPLERTFLSRNIPMIVDFDDAVFHRYDMHRSALVRHILGRKLDRLMASAALVTAGNRYLADRARKAGARRVEIVPTVVDASVYRPSPEPRAWSPAVMGWIGTPGTWSDYMVPMLPLFTETAAATGARISAVGAGRDAPHPLVDILPWAEDTEVEMIQQMDIGVMPLTDTPWARGKCGYKLIQYMACGLPVIASPVGVNAEIVEHGVNGFLASNETEWRAALATLIQDPELRRRMGEAGRRKVEEHYSLQVWGPKVARMIRSIAERGKS
ncbi:glycosyltransferase family 4 protein [Pseudooceanicola aestuarii]|uniref:glycosyltransferase family 4 protein n=1 Tax=Pseudooceanicola aestuarii TaxID=2697319 RepID=UPI001952DE6D|nr:glycosyltransferase family 4 protein [Pseudooceanicola aestuarii]